MTFKIHDNVYVSSATTGTGNTNIVCGAALTGKRDFSVYNDGETFPYALKDKTNNTYEYGVGTWIAASSSFSRDYISSSSNAGTWIALSGNLEVYVTHLASQVRAENIKKPPAVSGLLTRAGSGTITDGTKGIIFAQPFTATNTNAMTYACTPIVRGGTSKFDFIIKLRQHFGLYSWVMCGLCLKDNTGGSSLTMSIGWDATVGFNLNRFNSDTSWNANVNAFTLNYQTPNEYWIKLTDDNTTRTWFMSLDGETWMQIYTEAKSVWASSATHVGAGMNPNCGGGGQSSVQGKSGILEICSWDLHSY